MIDVVCEGQPQEMGRAQGAALAVKIHAARKALGEIEAFRRRRPWWLPYALYRFAAGRKAHRFLAGPLDNEHPEINQRLAGLAEGAGMSLGAVYLFNALEPLLSSIGGSTACPGGCSVVAVRGGRSASGEPILGRNFDYLPVVKPFYTIRDSRPKDGYRAFEFTVAPLAGAVDGMNQEGLCITYNYAFATDRNATPAVPISMLIC